MVKLSDDTPEAVLLHQQQSRRLLYLRHALGLSRSDAAIMAGVSRFTWRRMEEGRARIDTVPLRRFLAAYERQPNLSGEYVLSGSTAGFPPQLVDNLREVELTDPARLEPPSGGSHGPPLIPLGSKTTPRRKANNARSRTDAGQEAA